MDWGLILQSGEIGVMGIDRSVSEMPPPRPNGQLRGPSFPVYKFINLFLNQRYSENFQLQKYLVCVFCRLFSYCSKRGVFPSTEP